MNSPELPDAARHAEGKSSSVGEAEFAGRSGGGQWRMGALLESSGFLPANAQRVVDELRRRHGDEPPGPLSTELELARAVLGKLWRKPAPPNIAAHVQRHVLVGAPGVGKTTCLCKWLTKTVLVEGKRARVWRLDSDRANTAESLSIYCEILGVPLERSWREVTESGEEEVGFVDLPGVDWRDRSAIGGLAKQLTECGATRLHLVVNLAYETSLLLQQVRAFSMLKLEDLVISHVDEEARWGKAWNLVLGTNYSVGYLSGGQNIPGDFFMASAESLFARQFPA
jgi:flagellar biosynthesis GTPase FlhF